MSSQTKQKRDKKKKYRDGHSRKVKQLTGMNRTITPSNIVFKHSLYSPLNV